MNKPKIELLFKLQELTAVELRTQKANLVLTYNSPGELKKKLADMDFHSVLEDVEEDEFIEILLLLTNYLNSPITQL